MRVIAYIRVSTEKQLDGYGLDVQRDAVRAWARTNGHRLVLIFTEEGVSGKLEERPALAEALRALKDGQADGIVVPKLDRLARDLVVQEQLIAEVWRMGATVFSAVASEADYLVDDPADPSRKLIRQVLGAVSEYERAMIALRLRSGRARKAASGGYAYGAPAYGQKAVDKELTEDTREQDALARMIELADDGKSLREICAELEKEGHRPKRGDRWHPTTVNRCLTRARAAA
ncbi:Site-specific DNA recombinase [Parafrankia irregularis]|uniref:Site-specific DNA recombinase n=1 Tax=Parafrankia irregularis TaxID=795642 RepID=A0A0S4QEG9_9ACTN|nr:MULTISPECIES: recombinase family protein [Parafrankia]MBE3199719.1 recombinase family protein [Parafrankia sp. CH37]CUU53609.1 Site-specific DNA recombinase [Parafrankia irregularis]